MDDTELDRGRIDLSSRTQALGVGAASRRFPRCFSLPRVLVLACGRPSSSPDAPGGAGFLRSLGGNVVIKTQSIISLLDDLDVRSSVIG